LRGPHGSPVRLALIVRADLAPATPWIALELRALEKNSAGIQGNETENTTVIQTGSDASLVGILVPELSPRLTVRVTVLASETNDVRDGRLGETATIACEAIP
jgi:hypothetical protein